MFEKDILRQALRCIPPALSPFIVGLRSTPCPLHTVFCQQALDHGTEPGTRGGGSTRNGLESAVGCFPDPGGRPRSLSRLEKAYISTPRVCGEAVSAAVDRPSRLMLRLALAVRLIRTTP